MTDGAAAGDVATGVPPVPPVPRAHRWILGTLRWSSSAYLVDTLLQAVLAALFVTGDVDLLLWHEMNAFVNNTLLGVVLLAGILLWRPVRGPWWPGAAALLLLIVVQVEVQLGYERELALHIPVGVLMFGVASVLAAWTWQYRLPAPGAPGRKR
jgi:hypothetical protein